MQALMPKDSWEVNDQLVINGKHGTIKEFNTTNTKAYVEHKDNENQAYVRWYEVTELPPYPSAGEPFLPPAAIVAPPAVEAPVIQAPENLKRGMVLHHRVMKYNRVIESVDGLTITLAMGDGKTQWDSSIYEIRKPDEDVVAALLANFASHRGRITELEKKVAEQAKRIETQAASIAEMMKDDSSVLQDKFDQLTEDYESLEKQKSFVEQERDNLKLVNAQQSELLKQAAKPAPTNAILEASNSSLRAECAQLHRDLDKALKSPTDALELRLSRIEELLEDTVVPLAEARVLKAPEVPTIPSAESLLKGLIAFQSAIAANPIAFHNGNSAKLEQTS